MNALSPKLQRAAGVGRLSFAARDGLTVLTQLHQSGAAKIRLPKSYVPEAEAILINSAGGLAGGDAMAWSVAVEPGARAVITTQACERAYRTLRDPAQVKTVLSIAPGARLDWLPQETILYDRSALHRRVEADVAPDGTLLLAEAVLLGRLAHGETVLSASFHDRWRIRRGGKLVFAEQTRLEGEVAKIGEQAATLGGARAYATLVLIDDEAETLLAPVRAALDAVNDVYGGASAFDGKLICRMVAQDGLKLRRGLIPVLTVLRGGLGLPRVWTT